MKPITVEDMLQIGHASGLDNLEAAYSYLLLHSDLFFNLSTLNSDLKDLRKNLVDAGLTEVCPEGVCLINITIQEAADRLGIVLKDIDYADIEIRDFTSDDDDDIFG